MFGGKSMSVKYKRILLKLSGEVLAGPAGKGIDNNTVINICKSVKKVADMGVEVGIVVGGGNFWRGRTSEHMDRTRADHIGMLATVMNSLALCDALEQLGADVRVQTAIEMRQIAEPYIRNKAIRHFEKGRIIIFGCGTGSPFFSTDTAAALRSVEINADALLKATNVDGVYDKDPNKFDDAVKYTEVTFMEVLTNDLKVMDSTAFSLCKDNDMPIIVFNLEEPDNIIKVVEGEGIGTTVKN
jgi:uridylate kinase